MPRRRESRAERTRGQQRGGEIPSDGPLKGTYPGFFSVGQARKGHGLTIAAAGDRGPSPRPARGARFALLVPALLITVAGFAGAAWAAPRFSAWRAETLVTLGRTSAAQQWLVRSLWFGLPESKADYIRYRIASREGDLDRAVHWLHSAAVKGYPRAEVERGRRVLLAQSGRFAELGESWQELLAHPGADADAIYRGFVIYALAAGLTADADRVLGLWQAHAPDSSEPWRFSAVVAGIRSDWEAAATAYRSALERNPDDENLQAGLADCLMKQQQFAEASALWKGIVDSRQNSSAHSARETQTLDAANPQSPSAAGASRPGDTRTAHPRSGPSTVTRSIAARSLALCQLQLGRAAEAERTLSEERSMLLLDADAAHLMGRVSLDQKRYSDAVEWFDRAVSLRPESTPFRRDLAQGYRLAGRPDDAAALEPAIEEGERQLAEIRRLTGLLPQRPLDADLRYRLGTLTWRWMSHSEGLDWMRVVLRIAPQHAGATQFLSDHVVGGSADASGRILDLPTKTED